MGENKGRRSSSRDRCPGPCVIARLMKRTGISFEAVWSMRTEKNHQAGEGLNGPLASAGPFRISGAKRPWLRPAVRVSALPEVVRGAVGSKVDTFNRRGARPG